MFKNFSLKKISLGLTKTREKLSNKLVETFTGLAVVDDKLIDEIEDVLVSSDVGIETSHKIINEFRVRLLELKQRDLNTVISLLEEIVTGILEFKPSQKSMSERIKSDSPFVILIVGINGSGKTTTVGKLSNILKEEGYKITVGACDTFRAAATNQLQEWGRRSGVKVIVNEKVSDPSSVAFESVDSALKDQSDVVILDTAGRLHTKNNLMDELSKINRVLKKAKAEAPHEIILVLDGNNGQNAIVQAKEFQKVVPISGLIITKLDGTAKGGAIIQIVDQLKIPILFIGVGEGIDDLQEFHAKEFSENIFSRLESKVEF